MRGMYARETFIGNEVTNKRGKLTVKYPIERGIVTNWEDMEKIWHHAYYNMLCIDPEEHPLLMTESITNPKANQEKLIQVPIPNMALDINMGGLQAKAGLLLGGFVAEEIAVVPGIVLGAKKEKIKNYTFPVFRELMFYLQDNVCLREIMFETFKIPALYVGIQDILSLFSSGRTTGLVVHSGDEVTYSVPIEGGYILSDAIVNLEVSGQDLSTYLTKILVDKGYSLSTMAEWEMVRTMKEKLCYVALDYIEEMHTPEASLQKEYELPDGRIITMGRERFRCPEALFEPSRLGATSPGLHKNIHESLMKCDFEIRKTFYVNTILCGGNMSFPGMNERVTKEIKAQAPQMTKIKVVVPTECRFCSWFGGSILTTLNSFQHMWIYAYEYEDFGPSIIHRRGF